MDTETRNALHVLNDHLNAHIRTQAIFNDETRDHLHTLFQQTTEAQADSSREALLAINTRLQSEILERKQSDATLTSRFATLLDNFTELRSQFVQLHTRMQLVEIEG